MRILTTDNSCIDLNTLPETLEEDVRFSVLDNSDVTYPDFFFEPLMFLETFNSPAAVLSIGGTEVIIPLNWKISIGDSDTGNDLEVLPITSVYKRQFEAFSYNPINGFRPHFNKIELVNIFNDIKWFFPKMKNNQLLSFPLTTNNSPLCIFITSEISKTSEKINFTELL